MKIIALSVDGPTPDPRKVDELGVHFDVTLVGIFTNFERLFS
jgi:hypothetical protein